MVLIEPLFLVVNLQLHTSLVLFLLLKLLLLRPYCVSPVIVTFARDGSWKWAIYRKGITEIVEGFNYQISETERRFNKLTDRERRVDTISLTKSPARAVVPACRVERCLCVKSWKTHFNCQLDDLTIRWRDAIPITASILTLSPHHVCQPSTRARSSGNAGTARLPKSMPASERKPSQKLREVPRSRPPKGSVQLRLHCSCVQLGC